MWFGDERGYNATTHVIYRMAFRLWFGDERGYNATSNSEIIKPRELWFGDERGYNATTYAGLPVRMSCGLVMKEDITQLLMLI